MEADMSRVAVVTGIKKYKGIGLAIVKGLCQSFDGVVYLTSRDDTRGRNTVAELNKLGLHPEYHQLDVSDRERVLRFRDHIIGQHGGLDILINNTVIVEVITSYENCRTIIDINFRSVLTMRELIYPLVKNNGRILNIFSDCGHLSNFKNKYWTEKISKKDLTIDDINEFIEWFLESKKNGTFNPEDFVEDGAIAAYRVAIISLCVVTMVHQKELEPRIISVKSMHPGLVRTDMTIGRDFYSIDQAAETPIYLVLDAPQTLKGAYVWYDGKVLDWFDYNANYYFKINILNS